MPKVIKPSNHLRMFGFVLTTFSAPPQFWLHRQFSSAQLKRRMMRVMVLGATAAGLF